MLKNYEHELWSRIVIALGKRLPDDVFPNSAQFSRCVYQDLYIVTGNKREQKMCNVLNA